MKPQISSETNQRACKHHDMRYKERNSMQKVNNQKLLSFPAVIFAVATLSFAKAEGKCELIFRALGQAITVKKEPK